MVINAVKAMESFKNPVCDITLKSGAKKSGCDIGVGGDADKVIIFEDNDLIIYPFSEVVYMRIYEKES